MNPAKPTAYMTLKCLERFPVTLERSCVTLQRTVDVPKALRQIHRHTFSGAQASSCPQGSQWREPTLSRGLGVLPSPHSSDPRKAPDPGYGSLQIIPTKSFSRGGILRISFNWPVTDGAVIIGFLQNTTALKAQDKHGMMATLRLDSDPREASWTTPTHPAARRDWGHENRSALDENRKGRCGMRGEQRDVAGRAKSTGRRVGTDALGSDALMPCGLGRLLAPLPFTSGL